MKSRLYILAILTGFWLTSCHSHDDHSHGDEEGHAHEDQGHAHEEEGHTDEETNQNEVHLVQQQIDVMGIKMGHFQYINLSGTVKSNGRLELPPQNKARVSPIIEGVIKNIYVIEGDFVKKGQRLASIENPELTEMQEEYLIAKSRFKALEKEYNRKKEFLDGGVGSAEEFERIEADFDATKAQISSLKSRMELLGINTKQVEEGAFTQTIIISAPISGYVKMIEASIGSFIDRQTPPIFEIVDNDHIHIDLMVYQKDLGKIKTEQKVIFTLASDPDSVFEGRVFALGKSFEDNPKAIVVHAEIDNKSGNLLPGMYVDARIITEVKKVKSLPDEAIVSDGGLDYIFVMQSDKPHEEGNGQEYSFKKVEVKTGLADIGFTEVLPSEDVSDKDLIITTGAYYLMAEMKKGEGGHGHHH